MRSSVYASILALRNRSGDAVASESPKGVANNTNSDVIPSIQELTHGIYAHCALCLRKIHRLRPLVRCASCNACICRRFCTVGTKCITCFEIESLEMHLRQSFFQSIPSANGQFQFQGLSPAIYRQWFFLRPLIIRTSMDEAKRQRLVNQLHWKHVLHCVEWNRLCGFLLRDLNVSGVWISIIDRHHELIVASAGAMVQFSCFPREIATFDFICGVNDGLCIANVHQHAVFQWNPMLRALDANAYYGLPVVVDGTAVATISVAHESPQSLGEWHPDRLLEPLKAAARVIADRITMFTALYPSNVNAGWITRVHHMMARK